MKRPLFLLILVITIFNSCAKIGEYYAGLNLQPDVDSAGFKPGLNVYGVIKTGPDLDTINQYFEVERIVSLKSGYDSLTINGAEIKLERVAANGEVSYYKPLNTNDGIYTDTTIAAAPGDKWLYRCSFDTFVVTAECTIPDTPHLKNGAEITATHSVKFTVLSDLTAFMYDVYLLNGANYLFEKKVPEKGTDTEFELKPEWDPSVGATVVYIFAYDENLEKYYTTSNTFFKPNAFRPSFTTVIGGYGTFGGISSTKVVVN